LLFHSHPRYSLLTDTPLWTVSQIMSSTHSVKRKLTFGGDEKYQDTAAVAAKRHAPGKGGSPIQSVEAACAPFIVECTEEDADSDKVLCQTCKQPHADYDLYDVEDGEFDAASIAVMAVAAHYNCVQLARSSDVSRAKCQATLARYCYAAIEADADAVYEYLVVTTHVSNEGSIRNMVKQIINDIPPKIYKIFLQGSGRPSAFDGVYAVAYACQRNRATVVLDLLESPLLLSTVPLGIMGCGLLFNVGRFRFTGLPDEELQYDALAKLFKKMVQPDVPSYGSSVILSRISALAYQLLLTGNARGLTLLFSSMTKNQYVTIRIDEFFVRQMQAAFSAQAYHHLACFEAIHNSTNRIRISDLQLGAVSNHDRDVLVQCKHLVNDRCMQIDPYLAGTPAFSSTDACVAVCAYSHERKRAEILPVAKHLRFADRAPPKANALIKTVQEALCSGDQQLPEDIVNNCVLDAILGFPYD